MKKSILSFVVAAGVIGTLVTAIMLPAAKSTASSHTLTNIEALRRDSTDGPSCTGPKNNNCECTNTAPCKDMSGC